MIKPEYSVSTSEENPFHEDRLGRLEYADNLTQLISGVENPFVLNINAPYGTGKTTFISMWQKKLKKDGYHCVHFDTWDTDHATDPLIAFIGEMKSALESLHADEKEPIKKTFDDLIEKAGEIARKGLPVAIKILTALLLNKFVGDIDSEVFKEITGLSKDVAENKFIKLYEERKDSLKEFKNRLKEYVTELSRDENKPLLFFVDELDRCRPDYAIQLLERIKHLFNVPGIVFILATDRGQLSHSVSALYGQGMDAEGYLRRFINIDFQFPNPPLERFCRFLSSKHGLHSIHPIYKESAQRLDHVFIIFSEGVLLDLRIIQQSYARFAIIMKMMGQDIDLDLLALLTIIRIHNYTFYKQLANAELSIDEIFEYLDKYPGWKCTGSA